MSDGWGSMAMLSLTAHGIIGIISMFQAVIDKEPGLARLYVYTDTDGISMARAV